MDTALLAVVGTLAGVLVTATVSLVGVWLTSRNQRIAAEQSFRNALTERLRDEKRSVCIDYLTAYSNFREAALSAHQQHVGTGTTSSRSPKPVEYAPEAAAGYSRAHHALQITFDDPVASLEARCNRDIWDVGDNFMAEPNDFDRMWSTARASRLELHEAMRASLKP